MKASKYNFIYKYDDDNHLFYNSFSNALALVENENCSKYKDYIENGVIIDNEEFIQGLKDLNFLIDDDFDESRSIKLTLMKNRFDRSHLSLIIAPTTNCNFACTYCYEKNSDKQSTMMPLIQEKIVDFCEESIKGGVKSLDILWYGGEPLIKLDIIKSMSKKLIEICDKNNVFYSAGMITNGYNLTEKVCEELSDCRLGNIQVTLDGPKHVHDNRRILLNGKGTFDRIVENIKIASNKYHVGVRINVDEDNAQELENLLGVFEDEGLKGKIDAHLGFVENNNDCYTKGNCMTKKGFSENEHKFMGMLYSKGIAQRNPWLDKYPRTISVQCVADSINGLVISPNGDIFKCCCDIGIEKEKVGNILKINVQKYNNVLMDYLLYDPTEDEHCKECKILPICMGGCFKSREAGKEQRCSIFKYNLKEYLFENAKILNERESK